MWQSWGITFAAVNLTHSMTLDRAHLLSCLQKLGARLTLQDLEFLLDLIFQRSGWQRVGQVGRPQKTVDLELILPATGETAFARSNPKPISGSSMIM